jgi:hypothetical protein
MNKTICALMLAGLATAVQAEEAGSSVEKCPK